MNDKVAKDQWTARVLGVTFRRPGQGKTASGKAVTVAASVTAVPPPPPPQPPLGSGRPRSNAVIAPKHPPLPLQPVKGAGGKPMTLAKSPDGRVTLIAPPPKVKVLTLSGGGGKGAALPGAVRALERSGVLADVTEVTGASVGSMTAAMLASGVTADDFEEIGNDPKVAGQIKQGKNMAEVIFGGGLDGEGLESLVRKQMTRSVAKRIVEYVQAQAVAGKPPDPTVLAIAKKLADGKKGPTFGDLRALSKVIPAIKEVAISGSFMSEVDPETGKPRKGSEQSQLVIFNADTEPDLEVALAVHASAALPPVFKPVDIPLSSGITARFQDGGVLNNAPTPESIGAERDLDPIPGKRGMTFVFEDEASQEILDGKAVPRRSKITDWLTGAEHSAGEYAKNRGLADRPEDVVMLPLTFTVPPAKKGGKEGKKDFSGFLSGTVNFDMAVEDKLRLQALADEATSAHIARNQQPQPREFASVEQMLVCLPREDLAAMAGDGFEGAAEMLAFRDDVTARVADLIARVQGLPTAGAAARDPGIRQAVAELDQLTAGSVDRQAFVAREMNRSTKLDGLIQAMRDDGASATLQACCAVNDALLAKAHAKTVLRDVIYPKMVRTDPKGVSGNLLAMVDDRLRAALSPEAVNEALQMAIAHYSKRKDLLGLKGHKSFAAELERCLMKIGN